MMFLPPQYQIGQPRVHFLAEKAKNPPDLLQRNTSAAKLFNDEDFHHVSRGIDTVSAFSLGHNYALFIPPLQLAGSNAGQLQNIVRAEAVFQHEVRWPQNISGKK